MCERMTLTVFSATMASIHYEQDSFPKGLPEIDNHPKNRRGHVQCGEYYNALIITDVDIRLGF